MLKDAQRQRSNDAVAKDAQTSPREEVCAIDMGQVENDAVAKDAQTWPREEECARGTGHIVILMTTDYLYLRALSLFMFTFNEEESSYFYA